jgi:glycosyltransferase involved in cell wall biosynthesis
MSAPLVSIITPTYNHEKYIGDCIRSAQDQTYTNWEMIIVDDGSTDNTFTIAQIAAASDDRIKVFTQKNVGIFRLGETYNFAFAQSKGEYIAVLEGDDVWLPEKLQWQVEAMEINKNAVLSWGKAFSSSADLSADYDLHPAKEKDDEIFSNSPIGSAAKALIFTCFIPALTVMVRRASLESLGNSSLQSTIFSTTTCMQY